MEAAPRPRREDTGALREDSLPQTKRAANPDCSNDSENTQVKGYSYMATDCLASF